ncbi:MULTISPECIES: SDR family NAD(P)-dependent oxidoreductase [unclassified Streptomyces]|uniref:SDR family NAD(P)-dependent oxidoreductase n=1 Tax=unclassified Streptomyces TaxID=2593676 RepID=UPI003246A3B3
MDQELDSQVAVVTGASRGIGLAVVRALTAAGARVVAGARHSSDELDELAKTGAVEVVEVDLATESAPARLVARAGDRIDILVNNVGAAPVRPEGFLSITDEDWLASLTVNLLAAVRTTRAALPVMLAQGRGSIVNIASVNAALPDPLVLDYSAAKAALAAFSKGLSKEVGARGIRVNTVSPGPVATDLWLADDGVAATVSRATGADRSAVTEGAEGAMVTGRFTQPAEVADAVLFLAGARAANTVGADIRIDGGFVPTW